MLTAAFYVVLLWAVAVHGWAARRLRTEARRRQALDALDGVPCLGQCSCGSYWYRSGRGFLCVPYRDESHPGTAVRLVCERCGASRIGHLRAGGIT